MSNSMSSSSSSSVTLKEGAAVAISSSNISNELSCRFLSFKFSISVFKRAFLAAHFLPFLKHKMKLRFSQCIAWYVLPRFNLPLDYQPPWHWFYIPSIPILVLSVCEPIMVKLFNAPLKRLILHYIWHLNVFCACSRYDHGFNFWFCQHFSLTLSVRWASYQSQGSKRLRKGNWRKIPLHHHNVNSLFIHPLAELATEQFSSHRLYLPDCDSMRFTTFSNYYLIDWW